MANIKATLRYPNKNISRGDDYLKIQIVKYKAPGLTKQSATSFALRTSEQSVLAPENVKETIRTIILPMPSNIQDNNAADWVTGTMNPMVAGVAAGANAAVLSNNILGSLGQTFIDSFTALGAGVQTGEGQKGVAAVTAAGAVNALLGQGTIDQFISRAQGTVFNQNVELLFNGVTMRPAFQFSFDIVPRSKSESDDVKEIIRTFKKNMTPKKGTPSNAGEGLFISAPNVFRLQYMSGGNQHPFLHRFKPCALTQMSVNYNGSSQYSTYPDATPVHMQLTLQFQELSPIYAEEYDNTTEGREGVGY